VSNTAKNMQDPFDGVNPFTGLDDGQPKAFESPLVLEIDVLPPSEGLTGDYNQDGSVDAADYVVWRRDDGSVPGYGDWRSNFGTSSAGGGAIGTVPEPSALALLVILAGWAVLRR